MRDIRLLLGPLGAAIVAVGIAGLALLVPGYDPVRQTVSEIGEVGSPMQGAFTAMLCVAAACLVGFAVGLDAVARRAGQPRWPAWLVAAMAVSAAGVGVFAFPHPLHNVFGLSELIGYQAPLAIALAWRRDTATRDAAAVSAIFAALVWLAIFANLDQLFRDPVIWPHLKPVYGLVQRALFAAWFAWVAALGLKLYRAA